MYDHFSDLGRYVSILDRLMKMYYDRGCRIMRSAGDSSFMWSISTITQEPLLRKWPSVSVWIKER